MATGPALAAYWRDQLRHFLAALPLIQGAPIATDEEVALIEREVETACQGLEAAGADRERLLVMLQMIELRGDSLPHAARHLVRSLVQGSRATLDGRWRPT